MAIWWIGHVTSTCENLAWDREAEPSAPGIWEPTASPATRSMSGHEIHLNLGHGADDLPMLAVLRNLASELDRPRLSVCVLPRDFNENRKGDVHRAVVFDRSIQAVPAQKKGFILLADDDGYEPLSLPRIIAPNLSRQLWLWKISARLLPRRAL